MGVLGSPTAGGGLAVYPHFGTSQDRAEFQPDRRGQKWGRSPELGDITTQCIPSHFYPVADHHQTHPSERSAGRTWVHLRLLQPGVGHLDC